MTREAVVVAGETFTTKGALTKRVKEIKDGPLRVLQGRDHDFILDLLRRHPKAEKKIGCGVRAIHVVPAPTDWNPSHAFEIERVDGTRIDFSYKACISPSSSRQKFAKACRIAVVDQVLHAKRIAFEKGTYLDCPVSGERITWDTCHVDHAAPLTFEKIVDDFIEYKGLDVEAVHVDGPNGFSDKSVTLAFALFHAIHARLRVVSVKANLSLLRRPA